MRLGLDTKDRRLEARQYMVSKDAVLLWERPDHSAVYVYDTVSPVAARGKLIGAAAFAGTAGKPTWHYTFRTEADRDRKIAEFAASREAHLTYKAEKAAKNAAWTNPLKVGDVLTSSWGYDQTNVDFYEVTYVSGRAIRMRKIAQNTTETGFMSGTTVPAEPHVYVGEEEKHIAQPSGEKGVYITLTSYSSASLWDGKPERTSWYA